jgi:hypothetical protein
MTVKQYQVMIAQRFCPEDPQYSLNKHLIFDIEKDYIQLEML